MALAVALIAMSSYLAGLATASGDWVPASVLIAVAVALAWWLRTEHFARLDQRFHRGIQHAHDTRDRLRHLPEATEVHDFPKKRFWPT